MVMDISVEIEDTGLRRKLAFVSSRQMAKGINEAVGREVLERTKDFLDTMSVTRHKVADRLGAPHSKYLEYASGRLAGSSRGQTTELEDVDDKSATIAIKNTPGLARAFHDLHITPKRAKALTIPIDRVSHNSRVADLRSRGYKIFHPKGTNILATSERKGESARLRPLYALVQRVTVSKDEGLLPNKAQVREWAEEATEAALELKGFDMQ